MAQPVIMQWAISSFFGWGIYGLNLGLHWASDPEIEPVCASTIDAGRISVDPLRERALLPYLVRSVQFQAQLAEHADGSVSANVPLMLGLGNGFIGSRAAHNVVLEGQPTMGVIFFEEAMDAEAVKRGRELSLIITGSTWNERVLRAYGLDRVRTVLQGVDPTQFHPAPKLGVLGDRFLVFSGGKAELRKGQDIVLAAFKIFARRHPEATLVPAWHSPWPHLARNLDQTGLAAPVTFDKEGRLDIKAWAANNGIAAEQVLDLGDMPNVSMPSILREMDVAVFTNRAEGGTNLVAMECMACGVPTILSQNTGHLDLIGEDNCYPLTDQREVADRWNRVGDVRCWGESQVEEVVENLERVFADRTEAARRGRRGAATVGRLTWAETARAMKQVVLEAAKETVREAA